MGLYLGFPAHLLLLASWLVVCLLVVLPGLLLPGSPPGVGGVGLQDIPPIEPVMALAFAHLFRLRTGPLPQSPVLLSRGAPAPVAFPRPLPLLLFLAILSHLAIAPDIHRAHPLQLSIIINQLPGLPGYGPVLRCGQLLACHAIPSREARAARASCR